MRVRSERWCFRVPEISVAPREVAEKLFGFRLDRDTRSPQLAMEAFLTLVANGYADRDEATLRTPKAGTSRCARWRSARTSIRVPTPSQSGRSSADIGERLARRLDFDGFTNLDLAAESLAAVVDRETTRPGRQGPVAALPIPRGASLVRRPPERSAGTWSVRQVVMRGAGITVASMLADPTLSSRQTSWTGSRRR